MTISESAGKGADIKSDMNRQVAVARVATIPATLLANPFGRLSSCDVSG